MWMSKYYFKDEIGHLFAVLEEEQGAFVLEIHDSRDRPNYMTIYMDSQDLQKLGEALLEAAKDARKLEGRE
jgi:hypothetical protein